jgi:hypothetical protein
MKLQQPSLSPKIKGEQGRPCGSKEDDIEFVGGTLLFVLQQ